MDIEMDDGARETLQQGDVALIAPGHDAWVDGDERVSRAAGTGSHSQKYQYCRAPIPLRYVVTIDSM
ncbi:MAG: hypothetical protein ACNA7R_02245 [Natronococcus sp.]